MQVSVRTVAGCILIICVYGCIRSSNKQITIKSNLNQYCDSLDNKLLIESLINKDKMHQYKQKIDSLYTESIKYSDLRAQASCLRMKAGYNFSIDRSDSSFALLLDSAFKLSLNNKLSDQLLISWSRISNLRFRDRNEIRKYAEYITIIDIDNIEDLQSKLQYAQSVSYHNQDIINEALIEKNVKIMNHNTIKILKYVGLKKNKKFTSIDSMLYALPDSSYKSIIVNDYYPFLYSEKQASRAAYWNQYLINYISSSSKMNKIDSNIYLNAKKDERAFLEIMRKYEKVLIALNDDIRKALEKKDTTSARRHLVSISKIAINQGKFELSDSALKKLEAISDKLVPCEKKYAYPIHLIPDSRLRHYVAVGDEYKADSVVNLLASECGISFKSLRKADYWKFYNLAKYFYLKERYVEASAIFEEVILSHESGNNPPTLNIDELLNAYYLLAESNTKLGNSIKAIKYYQIHKNKYELYTKEDILGVLTQIELGETERVSREKKYLESLNALERTNTLTAYLLLAIIAVCGITIIIYINKNNRKLFKLNGTLKAKTTEVEVAYEEIRTANEEINSINDQLSQQQHQISESITYAKRIQSAQMPHPRQLRTIFQHSCVFYRPRDVVSGDYYWLHSEADQHVLAVGDCTGHGVPGAFMSLIGMTLLHQIVVEKNERNLSKVLNDLHDGVASTLKQADSDSRDGMELALVSFDSRQHSLMFANANIPMFVVLPDAQVVEVNPTKRAIGGYQTDREEAFKSIALDYPRGTWLFLSSDGYRDQFGGERGHKFGKQRFMEVLQKAIRPSDSTPEEILAATFDAWRGTRKQLDDVIVVGFQI